MNKRREKKELLEAEMKKDSVYLAGLKVAQKISNNVKIIAENYFTDTTSVYFGDIRQDAFNLHAMALACALNKNAILGGEPGCGKTTSATLVSSVFTGIPMDLYRKVMISGHPEQTEEKIIARPDYGALMDKKEKVIWQPTVYFPKVIIDEFNRFPEGKQTMFIDIIETSMFSYLSEVYHNGKKSFFATVNYEDGGNHPIIPPNKDRFSISLEFNNSASLWINETRKKSDKAKIDLVDEDTSYKLLEFVNDKTKDKKPGFYEEMTKEYKKKLRELNLEVITKDEYDQFRKAVNQMEFDDYSDADNTTRSELFTQHTAAEFNYTPTFGSKRSNDPIDTDTHAKDLASTKVKNAMSPRALSESWVDFAKGFALLNGQYVLRKEYLDGIFPYVFGHRCEFDDDFSSQFRTLNRNVQYDHFLAGKILEGLNESFRKNDKFYALAQNIINHFDFDLNDPAEKKLYESNKKERNEFVEKNIALLRNVIDQARNGSIESPLLNKYVEYMKNGSIYARFEKAVDSN
ncbi:MAG TPA: hypothetical protein VEC16_05450 [Alphaproteobacteria bacterium]|nr:hypothetical protein [Alphaproteobacteria bacterium]